MDNSIYNQYPTTLKQINWEELYLKSAMQLKGVCRRYTGDDVVAEDLVQETFITAIEKYSTFKGIGSFEGWIRKIAVNKALLYLREREIAVPIESIKHLGEQEKEMELPKESRRLAIERVSFTTDELLMVIDSLPVHHKSVFNLYVLDGYSHQQIAKMLNISPGTSKSHLARARKKAQELLYQKAIQLQPETNRRKGMFLLLLFQPNYIDRLFRKGMGDFGIPTGAPKFTFPSDIAVPIRWNATLAGKAILTGGSVCVVAVTGYVGLQLNNLSQTKVNPSFSVEVATTASPALIVPLDTLAISAKEISLPDSVIKQQKEKVFVKKVVVVHDTIKLEKSSFN